MAKNLMPEILKMLGMEYGEKFKLREIGEEELRYEVYCFVEDLGFRKLTLDGKAWSANGMLEELLTGYYEIVKLPWEPQDNEAYWTIVFRGNGKPFAGRLFWNGDNTDFGMKALNMVYRTEEEAKAHMAEDYMKLTGKKLEG